VDDLVKLLGQVTGASANVVPEARGAVVIRHERAASIIPPITARGRIRRHLAVWLPDIEELKRALHQIRRDVLKFVSRLWSDTKYRGMFQITPHHWHNRGKYEKHTKHDA